jgi:hypothetical protein
MYEEHLNDLYRVGGASPQEHRTPNRLEKFYLELASGDIVARSTPEMCEEFLQPNWDEYCEANYDCPGQIVRCSSSGRSKDELMKIAISLALAALELAEIELLDRLNAIYLEATTEIAID